jgi:hypothetical protein
MKSMLRVLGILALVAAGAPGCGLVQAKSELEPLAMGVLIAVQEGRYEEVHRNAAPVFRESTSLEEFRAYAAVRRKALGAFRRIVKTGRVGLTANQGSPTLGQIAMDVEYERGPAQAEFEFRKEGEAWRLGMLKIAFDEKLLPGPEQAALEPLARELLGLYDASGFVALYDRFSKGLQEAWPAAKYEPEVRDLRAQTGKIVEATLRETKEEGAGKVRLLFDVRFESGTGEADLSFVWQAAEWHVIGFHLHKGQR